MCTYTRSGNLVSIHHDLSNHSAALCFNLGPRMLDILLLTILTEKDEVERTSALVFLEEHGKSLVWDEE